MNQFHNLDSELNVSDVVLRKHNKSILTAKVSIPRVSIDNCDKCGHRLSKRSENQDSKKSYSRRPHSIHIGQDNYLYLEQINEVEFVSLSKNWDSTKDGYRSRKQRPRTCHLEPEHIYEEVKKESQMKTLDIRVNQCRKEKRRKSDNFVDNMNDGINGYKVNTLQKDHSEKADSEFEYFDSHQNANNNKSVHERVDVFRKVNVFKRNLLARMSSLVNS
eukprot:TRINITY_DN19267_c0_g1_i5.p1 TRINITY_DN19267_c0_g1~~TRINITY_DN19267_c0_g1_i5.p1  ORF type:complete len:218 (-),score=50.08 TRINITY_DN19267_c0_g1_i5:125-778(-)